MSTRFDQLPDDLSAAEFADIVAAASDSELAEAMLSEQLRARVLQRVFTQMPARLRQNKARNVDAVVRWKVGARPDVWDIRFANGECEVIDHPGGQRPTTTLELDDVTFLRLIAGQTTGMKLLISGKLKVRGDVLFARRIETLFDTTV